jgi:membrane-bound serine protease (ClpP class)
MEVLLNPNVAYILLVAGFSLTVMAILAPGTGLLEILALFTLVLAGYGVYNIPFNWWALVLLILGVVPFILALRKFGNLLFLFISILAMVIGSSFLFRGETWYVPAVNPILAVVVSLMTASYFWIALSKILEAEHNRPTHDLSTKARFKWMVNYGALPARSLSQPALLCASKVVKALSWKWKN